MTRPDKLSRRERQIMDVLYQMQCASAKQVMANIDDAPSYSSVRTLLGKMVEKGHIAYKEDGPKYVYYPLVEKTKASQSALSNVVKTFFEDSPYLAVNTLLDMDSRNLSTDELDQLDELIQTMRKANDPSRDS
ncbi:MAG: BlaI/MecI/CopY family transcriptional regulator [Pseudohongiellaceae bacterium]|nr:BlaI/MecI/CopY family transcriptional regulator [Pseudohongiellaceae bacterium]